MRVDTRLPFIHTEAVVNINETVSRYHVTLSLYRSPAKLHIAQYVMQPL